MASSDATVSREQIERALLSEADHFNRSRVIELERHVQELMLAADMKDAHIEKLNGELGHMAQLSNLTDQLKQDNANLCADLEANQLYMQQEFSQRDNTSVQRDELKRKLRRTEKKNETLRKQCIESDSRLAAANERASKLRDHLAKTMQRAAEMENRHGHKSGAEGSGSGGGGGGVEGSGEGSGVFGAALIERLEELEEELQFAKAAAARITTRYVLREATKAFQPVYMEEIHTVTGRFNKVSGVFASRKTAEMTGQLSKLKLDYKSLSMQHETIEKEYTGMIEETEMLRRQLKDCMKQLRNSRLETAMKLAMQKSVLSKEKLSSALYLSRGGGRSRGLNGGGLGIGLGIGGRRTGTGKKTSRSNTALHISSKKQSLKKNLPKLKQEAVNIVPKKSINIALQIPST
jgi:hypothetical protein